MSIIHVNQIRNQLEKLFLDTIDLSDLQGSEQQLKNFFLTRALAAYAVYYLAQAEVVPASESVVDGSDDNGIDAIYYDEVDKTLFIVQSKFIHNGKGEPDNGDIKKFLAGVRDLFNLDFGRFNDKITRKSELISRVISDPLTKYEVVVAYTGINKVSGHSQRDLDDLLTEMNDASEVLHVTVLNQTDLHTSLTAGVSGEPISIEVGLRSWGRLLEPHLAFYGQVDGVAIADWWSKYRTRLFSRNLRSVLGDTKVNDEIKDTITSRPEHFWYFNNGITLISRQVSKSMVGGADTSFGTFHCEDISIVNGAQTVGAIGRYGERTRDKLEKVYVPIRIISLENGDHSFGEDITKTNNRQNRIENRDFVSLDPEQKRIKDELAIDGIEYHVVRSDTATRNEAAFDLVESTTALACASSKVHLVVQLKREIGRLWENISKSPYKELFNTSTSGLYTWRVVQVQRLIDRSLERIEMDLGVKSGREYGIAVHGNRLIAALVFSQLPVKKFANPMYGYNIDAVKVDVDALTRSHYERLRDRVEDSYSNAIIPTLFKNASKCRDLFEAIASKELVLEG